MRSHLRILIRRSKFGLYTKVSHQKKFLKCNFRHFLSWWETKTYKKPKLQNKSPLKISFWTRGNTSVAVCSCCIRSLTLDDAGNDVAMFFAPNLTVRFIVSLAFSISRFFQQSAKAPQSNYAQAKRTDCNRHPTLERRSTNVPVQLWNHTDGSQIHELWNPKTLSSAFRAEGAWLQKTSFNERCEKDSFRLPTQPTRAGVKIFRICRFCGFWPGTVCPLQWPRGSYIFCSLIRSYA